MQFEKFSLDKLDTLSKNEMRNYIDKYFIPLTNGDHAMLIDNNKYAIFDDDIIKKTQFNRMDPKLRDYYFKEKRDLKSLVYELNKPQLYGDYLNLCPKLINVYKECKLFEEEIKNNLELLFSYIKEVLCNNREDCFEYLMKWLSNMIKGVKNDSVLYLKEPQGIGK